MWSTVKKFSACLFFTCHQWLGVSPLIKMPLQKLAFSLLLSFWAHKFILKMNNLSFGLDLVYSETEPWFLWPSCHPFHCCERGCLGTHLVWFPDLLGVLGCIQSNVFQLSLWVSFRCLSATGCVSKRLLG